MKPILKDIGKFAKKHRPAGIAAATVAGVGVVAAAPALPEVQKFIDAQQHPGFAQHVARTCYKEAKEMNDINKCKTLVPGEKRYADCGICPYHWEYDPDKNIWPAFPCWNQKQRACESLDGRQNIDPFWMMTRSARSAVAVAEGIINKLFGREAKPKDERLRDDIMDYIYRKGIGNFCKLPAGMKREDWVINVAENAKWITAPSCVKYVKPIAKKLQNRIDRWAKDRLKNQGFQLVHGAENDANFQKYLRQIRDRLENAIYSAIIAKRIGLLWHKLAEKSKLYQYFIREGYSPKEAEHSAKLAMSAKYKGGKRRKRKSRRKTRRKRRRRRRTRKKQ